MVQAKWNGAVIADAKDDEVFIVESNTYFPPTSLKMEYLKENQETYTCPWKGTCNYYDVVVNCKYRNHALKVAKEKYNHCKTNPSAAWVYREPKEKAKSIKGRVAFWKGVQIG